jgi:hypothetical protein
MTFQKHDSIIFVVVLALLLASCAGTPNNPRLANQCEQGLNTAFNELDRAKANGFSGAVSWTKAATLLSTAKIQQQFNKFPNCVNKIKRARYYIQASQQQ